MTLLLFLLTACDGGDTPTTTPSVTPDPAPAPAPAPAPKPTPVAMPSKGALLKAGLCSDDGTIQEMQVVSLSDGRSLIEVTCAMYAYQGTFSYAWPDGRPVVDQDGDPIQLLGFPGLDAETGVLSWLSKARGPGDCGDWYRYTLEQDRFVLQEHRSRSCDAETDPETFPPPHLWPLQGPYKEGLCANGETVYFSCPVSASKVLSVCGSSGEVQYRFGPPGAPELSYPHDGSTGPFGLSEVRTVRSVATVLTVTSNDIRYEVTDAIGGGGGPDAAANNFQGVYVYQGDKQLAAIRCNTEPTTDWSALQPLLQ